MKRILIADHFYLLLFENKKKKRKRKQSHSIIKSNTIVSNKFNKEVKYLNTANYVTLIKKIKGDTNKLTRDPVFMNWKN